MKSLRNEPVTDDFLKIFEYAIAPNGGMVEALQLADAIQCAQFKQLVEDIDSMYNSILAATNNEATRRQYDGKLHLRANQIKQNLKMPSIHAEATNDKSRVLGVLKRYKAYGGYFFAIHFYAKIVYMARTPSGMPAGPAFWDNQRWSDGTPVHKVIDELLFSDPMVVECVNDSRNGLWICERIADGVAQGVFDAMSAHGYEGIENISVHTNLPKPSNIIKFEHIITCI